MAAPNIKVTPEPRQGQAITFQLLAPASSGEEPHAQISVLLKIVNREAKQLVLRNVGFKVFFSDNRAPLISKNPVNLSIAPNENVRWHNKVFLAEAKDTGLAEDTFINQNIITSPLANIIQVILKFKDFDEEAKVLFALRRHESPVPKKAYQFPAKKGDLRPGECWSGVGGNHAQSSDGNQLFALDLGVNGWDKSEGGWRHLLPGALKKLKANIKNADYRIWRKPVYAMADGEVIDFRADFPENEKPNVDLDPAIVALMTEVEDGNGNFIKLQTGDEIHLYAHFGPDSVPSALRRRGAKVKKGALLGKVGNSGNSSAPHLHIGVLKYRRLVPRSDAEFILRPMPFVDMHSIRSDKARGIKASDPWFKHTSGHGLCLPSGHACLIWPSRALP